MNKDELAEASRETAAERIQLDSEDAWRYAGVLTIGSDSAGRYMVPRPPDLRAEAIEAARRMRRLLGRIVVAFLLVVGGLVIASLGQYHG